MLNFEVVLYDEGLLNVTKISGVIQADELNTHIGNYLETYVRPKAPAIVHTIYDVRELTWSFIEFTRYLGMVAERRNTNRLPTNLRQYFLGSNQWITSFEAWSAKQQNQVVYKTFNDLDMALDYIRQHR